MIINIDYLYVKRIELISLSYIVIKETLPFTNYCCSRFFEFFFTSLTVPSYHGANKYEGGCLPNCALNACHTARAIANKITGSSGGDDSRSEPAGKGVCLVWRRRLVWSLVMPWSRFFGWNCGHVCLLTSMYIDLHKRLLQTLSYDKKDSVLTSLLKNG
jgi:hypothetical protein